MSPHRRIDPRDWRRTLLLILAMTAPVAIAAYAQPALDVPNASVEYAALADMLIEQGFENVSIDARGSNVVVEFENRVYPYEAEALQQVILLLAPRIAEDESLVLIPLNRGVHLLSLTIPAGAYGRYESGSASVDQLIRSFEVDLDPSPLTGDDASVRRLNRHTFKLDLVAHPQFAAELGKFGDPFETQFNIAPALSTSLWRGMQLTAQAIIPLQNELAEADGDLRPGLITLNQVLRPAPRTLLSLSGGYFSEDRWGFDGGLQHFLPGGRLSVGGRAGYTGFLTFASGQWLYDSLNLVTYGGHLRYYLLPEYSFWVQVGFGKYLFEDRGWRVDAHRRFGQVEVQLFAFVTDADENAGVRVVVPLFPWKHMKPRRVRVRSADSFTWEYRFDKLTRAGSTYGTGAPVDAVWDRLEPGSLRYDLLQLSGW